MYKRQGNALATIGFQPPANNGGSTIISYTVSCGPGAISACLLYTSDAADERSSVDLGGRRIIKKKSNAKAGRVERNSD